VWRYPALRHLVVVDVAEEVLVDVEVVLAVDVEVVAAAMEETHTVGDVEVRGMGDQGADMIATAVVVVPPGEDPVVGPVEVVAVIPEEEEVVHATVHVHLCPGEVADTVITRKADPAAAATAAVEATTATIKNNSPYSILSLYQ